MKILIVEDEAIIAEAIKEMAEEIGYQDIILAHNFEKATELLASTKFELALLDINLSDKMGNGFDIAKLINEKYNFPFLFITAYSDSENLKNAKNLNPHGYLLKPINKERLFVAIELALENLKARKESPKDSESKEIQALFPDSFFVNDGQVFIKIQFDDVLFLKSEGNYTEIHTQNKIHVVRCLLGDIDKKLPKNLFKRTHRSYIIRLSQISSISQSEIKIGNNQIPVGETFKKDVVELIKMLS